MASHVGGITADEYRQREKEYYEATETLTRCAFCPNWFHIGSAVEGRQRGLEHRREVHPEIKAKTRRTVGQLKKIRPINMSKEESDEIILARKRRAYLIGVDIDSE